MPGWPWRVACHPAGLRRRTAVGLRPVSLAVASVKSWQPRWWPSQRLAIFGERAGRDGGAGSGQKGIQGALAAIWVRFCHRVLNLPGKRPEQSKNKARVATRPAVPQSIACPLPASQRRAKFSRPNQSCLF